MERQLGGRRSPEGATRRLKGKRKAGEAMREFKFYPGVAAGRLTELAVAKTKIGVIRDLVEGAAEPESERNVYVYVMATRLGSQIKKHRIEAEVVRSCAKKVLELAKELADEGVATGDRDILDKPRENAAFSVRLTDGQTAKLNKLALRSDLSKSMVLRFLILGLELPDRLAMRTAGRLAMVGGLIRHVAYEGGNLAWRGIGEIGLAVSRLARPLLMREGRKVRQELADYDQDDLQTH